MIIDDQRRKGVLAFLKNEKEFKLYINIKGNNSHFKAAPVLQKVNLGRELSDNSWDVMF